MDFLDNNITKSPAANERFGVMAAEARRKCSANLQLPVPQEVQWKPPPRQAATTLCASKILRFLASVSVEIGVAH